MPFDRSQIRRGMYLTGGMSAECRGVFTEPPAPRYRTRKELGLDIDDEKAERLSAERKAARSAHGGCASQDPRAPTMSATWQMSKMLSELMARHGVELELSPALPLADPTDHPLVLEGYASTSGVDSERCEFAPRAFGDLRSLPPLLFEHDPQQIAGRVEQLSYDDRGQLLARVYAEHAAARRCGGFSVGAHVLKFEIRNAGDASFSSYIIAARLTDLSLVSRPVQSKARFLQRSLPSPASCFAAGTLKNYDLLIQRVKLLQQQTQLIKEMGA